MREYIFILTCARAKYYSLGDKTYAQRAYFDTRQTTSESKLTAMGSSRSLLLAFRDLFLNLHFGEQRVVVHAYPLHHNSEQRVE